jgi:hypothetical protein
MVLNFLEASNFRLFIQAAPKEVMQVNTLLLDAKRVNQKTISEGYFSVAMMRALMSKNAPHLGIKEELDHSGSGGSSKIEQVLGCGWSFDQF